MDEQKLNDFLNEQNLVNMSIIDQLNKQAEFLDAIVERLEIIYGSLQTTPLSSQEIVNSTQQSSNNTKNYIEERKQIIENNVKKVLNKQKNEGNTGNTEDDTTETALSGVGNAEGEVTININESDSIDLVTNEVNRYIVFGDRIQVISQNAEHTGVFIELDHQYLVWVIDEGKLTFTDIIGATIIKIT